MPYWTYILQSETTGRYYCGSSDNIERRVAEHNDPNYHGSRTTKHFQGPWKLAWMHEHATRSAAMELEKKIKKRGIGRFLAESNIEDGGQVHAQLVESRAARD